MASYASTTSHLRTSVFDAAFEIGLADPRLTEWLESVPESPTEKTPPVASQGNQHWSLSSGSSTSHGSLTTIASESSQSSPVRHDIHTRSPAFDPPQQRTPDTMMPNSRYPSPILSPPTPRSHPVVVPPIVFPSPPEPEPETSPPLKKPPKRLVKLTRPLTPKKSGQPDKVKSRDTEEKRSADDDRVHYDFLDTEPPTDSDKKDHRSFFGRLRDRSRSKSRMRKKDDHRANDDDASRRSDESKDLAQHDGRGRDVSRKPVQAVIVTQNGGAPQLQLTQPNNRQSSDLLKALNAQLGTTSLAPGSAYLADLKIALPPSPTTPKQSVKLAVGPGTGPRPRVSVMDRPHPKIRTSGYFVNRDRGVPVSRGGTSRVIHVGRKTTASRKVSIRGTAGASSAAVKRAASGRRLALGNSGSASPRGFNRRGSRAIKLTEEQEAEIAEVEAEAITKPDEMPAAEAGRFDERPDSVDRPNLVLQIPVIIERQASIKRQPKPDPPSFNGLTPSLPKPSNSLSPSPSTSARSLFGVRLRRFSHNNLPPSPLKPPTSPLPPTPSVPVSPGQSMTPSLPSRSVSPTPPRSPGANSDGGESHWFEDDSSDEDSAPIVISQLPRRREGDFPETPTSMNPSVDDTLRLSTGSAFSQPRQAPTPPVAPRDGHPSPATRPTLRTLTLPEPRPRLSPSPSPLGRKPEMPMPSPRSDAAPYPLATRVLSNTPERAPSPSPVANAPAGSSTNVRFAGETPEPERSTTPAPSAWNAKALMGSILKPSALKKGRKDGAPAPIEIPSITPAGSAAPTPSFLSVPPETGRTTPSSALSRTSSISSVSGAQRGRTTPFPARPVPPLSRSPSIVAMRRRVDEGSIYGDAGGPGVAQTGNSVATAPTSQFVVSLSDLLVSIMDSSSTTARRLVVSIDVGTDFSRAAYAIQTLGGSVHIQDVTTFPGGEGENMKVPTVVLYNSHGKVLGCGFEVGAIKPEARQFVVERFKLHMCSHSMGQPPAAIPHMETPNHIGVTQIMADFLQYMKRAVQSSVSASSEKGSELWDELEGGIICILSHPNGWAGEQQAALREAAARAGLIPNSAEGQARLVLVSEGEASFHWCVDQGLTVPNGGDQPSSHIVVVNAGAGIVSISSFKSSDEDTARYREASVAKSILAGSNFVTWLLEGKIAKRLNKPAVPHVTRAALKQEISHLFDNTIKNTYSEEIQFWPVKLETPLKPDARKGLSVQDGIFKVSGTSIRESFLSARDDILKGIQEQINDDSSSDVLLVGGFFENLWLYGQLVEGLGEHTRSVRRCDDISSNAVARGAITSVLQSLVTARTAKDTYGIRVRYPYDPNNNEHVVRENRVLQCEASGRQILSDGFLKIVTKRTLKGELVPEGHAFRIPVVGDVRDKRYRPYKVDLYRYSGIRHDIQFLDADKDAFQLVCKLSADAPSALLKERKRNDMSYWTVDINIVLELGMTELACHVEWGRGEEAKSKIGPAFATWLPIST
ncbi:hypothetical protein FRB99_003526 [Tulasnella sp. 403]|nr:hypothetical protein FRB99_003526 [Tulasnella sp. 403]